MQPKLVFSAVALAAILGTFTFILMTAKPPEDAAPPPTPENERTVAYTCTPEMNVSALYRNAYPDAANVVLTLNGETFILVQALAASGVRYAVPRGSSSPRMLTWWTKGREATLYEGGVDNPTVDGTVLAQCAEAKPAT